jgi:purine nucleoside permease
MKTAVAIVLAFCSTLLRASESVKVVVLTTFELGKDKGDEPGEFQFWVEREGLDREIPFAGELKDIIAWPNAGRRSYPLRTNGRGLYGLVTGTTSIQAAATVLSLGFDPRFDFSKTYWIVAAIAGADPEDASLGSAAWAHFVVNGDPAYEIDVREMPRDWGSGVFPLGAKKPGEIPANSWPMAHALDQKLVQWAFALTRDTPLPDDDTMRAARRRYRGFQNAQRPPFVLMGDSLASDRFWHGEKLNRWANNWTKLWTRGQGNFVMTNTDDAGIAGALARLASAGKIDASRFLVLRTASNYSMQPPDGTTAYENLRKDLVAYRQSLEAAYRVAGTVVHELLNHWDRYRDKRPGE